MAVAVGGLAGAVGAALVTAVAGAAGVAGLELGGAGLNVGDSRGGDGGGSHEGGEEGGELHFERGLKIYGCLVGINFVGWTLVVKRKAGV